MNNKFIDEMINLPWIKFKSDLKRTYFRLPLLSCSCSTSALLSRYRWLWFRGWILFTRFLCLRPSSLRSWHHHFLIRLWLQIVLHLLILLLVLCGIDLRLRDHLRKILVVVVVSIYSVDEVPFFTEVSWPLSESMTLLTLLDSSGGLTLIEKVRH